MRRNRSGTVAGRGPVVEALRAGVPATDLYVARGVRDARIREAVGAAERAGIPVVATSRQELDALVGGHHQGVAMRLREHGYADPDDLLLRAEEAGEPPLVVALDGITDPHNLGAVVRSVAAFGGHGVVVPGHRSAGVGVGAWKASAGTLAHVPVGRAPNLTRVLERYQRRGLFVAGLAATGAVSLAELEVAVDPLVLVLGAEGRGLSRVAAKACDVLVTIPMAGRAESLNASVAAGIALYEIARRRRAQ
ncbi:MAG: 23S rRNA (guanosine(2251)-2'-O)-methyltransferase RlmB [Streptosporangiaceae bacterium]